MARLRYYPFQPNSLVSEMVLLGLTQQSNTFPLLARFLTSHFGEWINNKNTSPSPARLLTSHFALVDK